MLVFAAGSVCEAVDKFGLSAEEMKRVDRILKGDGAAPEPAVLRWRNGEALKGEIAEADAQGLRWKTTLFETPLAVSWKVLRRIDQALPAVAASEAFCVTMKNGSQLYGDLVAVTDQTISFKSARHGDVTLKQSAVLGLRRLRGDGLIFTGPTGDTGWKAIGIKKSEPSGAPPSTPLLRAGPGGALLLPYWNRGAVLDVKIPEMVEIEFRVKSSERPDFQISIDADSRQRLQVETWGEDLVLMAGEEFKSIRKLNDSEREMGLRLGWNLMSRKVSVFAVTGEPLVEWEVPEARGEPGQIALQNKGRDLALEFLRVRTWNGKPPPTGLSGNLPRLELADGQIIEGHVAGGEAGKIVMRAKGTAALASYPVTAVDTLILSTDEPKLDEHESTLTFADGGVIRGRISSIKDGQALLEASFSETPFPARVQGLRQWLLDDFAQVGEVAEPSLEEMDVIKIQDSKLHGRLSAAGDRRPRWLPIGGVEPALIAQDANCEIIRGFAPGAKMPGASALFFTASGDVLPGSLRALDRAGVEIEDGLFEKAMLPAGSLEAIIFNATTSPLLKGFDDPGWRLKGEEKTAKTAESVRLLPGNALSHSSLMRSSEIQFSMKSEQSFGGMRLRLFSDGEDRSDASSVILANLGGRLYSTVESVDGQGDDGMQQTSVSMNEGVKIRLLIEDDRVEVEVNGVSVRKFTVPANRRKGAGLVIKPANVFGNQERPITLSDFSAKSNPGRVWVPEVNNETRTQTLTIPRFRKDDPPRHALLAANGDVLRGEIEAVTVTHFGFRSGLENLRVPRERVKAAVWLKKPGKAAAPAAKDPTAEVLKQVLTRRIRYSNASLTSIMTVLQREAPGLKFRFPQETDSSRKATMQFGGQTIAKALDEICALFQLRYRVEDDGTLLLESGPGDEKEMIEKAYWMKPETFPSGEVAKEALGYKGISFPAKSSVSWEPHAGQLTMSNTAANHEKLAALVIAEFGGSLGSPTHWLLLTSGARFALAVEKFEDDFVSGSHPLYGKCRVPLSHIQIIRTTPPTDSAPAAQSLGNWRLVYAAEPVIPEDSGESSPLVGKPAKAFKLPLLSGGDFELAKEKGKVVVLDFWATWCGPCIQSLPGLIEAMSAFPSERVSLIGVNQSESAELLKTFLQTRGWKLTVALDAGQRIGQQYGVQGIPHTVIVGPDGKVAWVKTGFSPDGAAEVGKVVKGLLEGAEEK